MSSRRAARKREPDDLRAELGDVGGAQLIRDDNHLRTLNQTLKGV